MARRTRKKNIPEGVFSADICGLTHEGRGIAKLDGKTTFIQFALPKEKVEFEYKAIKSKYDEAWMTNVLKPSLDRIKPVCDSFLICGGCSLQHMSTDFQLKMKQDTLKEQFKHFGDVEPLQWLKPLYSDDTEGYRKKARLGVRYVIKKEKLLVGFRERNGRYLADINSCPVLHSSVGTKIPKFQELILSLDCYMTLPQIEVAVDDYRTALIFRHLEPLSAGDLDKISIFAKDNDFWIYLQSKGADTIKLFYPENNLGQQHLSYRLPEYDLTIQFGPNDFIQVNSNINNKMLNQALRLLDIKKDETILDLFCGLGNFSLPMAIKASHVVGVEADEPMTKRAYQNALLNNIENVDFYSANLFDELSNNDWANQHYDKILLDPPRAGALEVVKQINQFSPSKIVYVSCNPATLARDAGILVNEKGYTMIYAGVMDMFPHTTHVESMAVFEKKAPK